MSASVERRASGRRPHSSLAIIESGLREIAEIVGKIGVDALNDAFVAVIAVLAEWHLTQQEIPDWIDAIRA